MMLIIILFMLALMNLVAFYIHRRAQKAGGPREDKSRDRALLFYSIARPLGTASLRTRDFIRQAYAHEFNLFNVILFFVLGSLCLALLIAEFAFLQQSIALLLSETEETPVIVIFAGRQLRLSHLMAVVICSMSGIFGYLVFQGAFNARSEHSQTTPWLNSFGFKLLCMNFLVILCVVEGFFGYNRGTEIAVYNDLQTMLSGNATSCVPEANDSFAWVNTGIGLLLPIAAGFTFHYLLAVSVWLFASILAFVLFALLWLPAWLFDRLANWQMRNRGTDEQPHAHPHESQDDSVLSAAGPPHEPAQGERTRMEQTEQNEENRREQTNMNPFD